jgi:hypothetical protein
MDIEAVVDNTKYSGMSYRPMSLAEKMGIKEIKKEMLLPQMKETNPTASPKKVESKPTAAPKKVESKPTAAPKKVESKPTEAVKKVEIKENKSADMVDLKSKKTLESGVCGVDADGVKRICGSQGPVFSMLDPRFNLRESCKNMILLENRLLQEQRCEECILKHSLAIEGFLEDGLSLDTKGEYKEILTNSFKEFRAIFRNIVNSMKDGLMDDKNAKELAERVRKMSKPLCQKFGTFVA